MLGEASKQILNRIETKPLHKNNQPAQISPDYKSRKSEIHNSTDKSNHR